MNEENNLQPSTPTPSEPVVLQPEMYHPAEVTPDQTPEQTAQPTPVVQQVIAPQPESTPMPTVPVTPPSSAEPISTPPVTQNDKPNSIGNNDSSYNSNPFIAVGKGLGSALFTNPVASILLAVVPFLAIFPAFFLVGLIGGLSGNAIVTMLLGLVAIIVVILVVLRASAGTIVVLLDSSKGDKVTTKEAMGSRSSKNLTSYFVSITLMSIFIFIGLLLFIIPGIFLIARLSLAPILVYAEDLKAMAAIKRSFKLTKGHAFEMLSVIIAQSMLASNGLLSTISSNSGIARRYVEIVELDKSGTSDKPKTHWLNFALPFLAMLLFIPYVALSIMSANLNNSNSGTGGFGPNDDFGFSTYSSASDAAADTTRKSDINALYQKLEEYYNENGSYPNETISSNSADFLFPGIDSEALIDENGNEIVVNFDDSPYIVSYPIPDSTYQYELTLYGEGCDGFSADNSCQSYTLASYQATGIIDYVKNSLN